MIDAIDISDDEVEAADEEKDHVGSVEAVPRSDADHLRQLDGLGINAATGDEMQLMQLDDGEDLDAIHEPDPKRQKIADVGPTHLNEETTVNPIGKTNGLDPEKVATSVPYPSQTDGKQQLRGGANWFKEKLAMSGLRAVIQNLLPGNHGLEDASASGVRQMLIRHSLIRACNCHVEVSADLSTADIFAKGWQAAFEAKKLFGLPDGELETTLLQQDAGAMPDGCEEEENLESVEMSWVRHAAHWSFSHDTVRPSYIDQKSQSLQPNLKSWTFKHKLDPVQARAIACVENDESVMFCAPTSAGKTVVATYAVAMALHWKKRAIYTTPIKALSNQKFLELGKAFGGQYVGIMTGDTVIATDAPIVVMTLEILQSMLYKQARDPNLLDDFQCVVIDEAHFLGDLERGYAWEEVLILLPPHVKLVLLSATMPNARVIADWCARIRTQPMHVVVTEQRPVPLSHDIFRCGPPDYFGKRRSFFSIMRPPKNRFHRRNLKEAVRQRAAILQDEAWRCPPELAPRLIGKKGQNVKRLMSGLSAQVDIDGGVIEVRAADSKVEREAQERVSIWLISQGVPEAAPKPPNSSSDPLSLRVEDLERLLSLLKFRDELPTIGFCFDKRMCERVALLLAGAKRMDFSNNATKQQIHKRLEGGLAHLDQRDKQLAQVKNSCDLLVRGIGVHHGGMLPLLREMVELLFADGLLPVIFATETFAIAIGLNMPAKSVIFTDVVKFDGRARRLLKPGEFRQMSGRAGRRGLDWEGHVYVMLHSDRIMRQPAEQMLTQLYTEEPSPVDSCYRVRWSSLLHLISAGPAHLYTMLHRSLQRFTDPNAALALQQEATRMVKVLQELDFIDRSGAPLPKGTMACHLFVPEDALLVADVIIALKGFEKFTAPQAFAICAAFVTEGPYSDRTKISDKVVRVGLQICRRVARKLASKLHFHQLPCCKTCGLNASGCDGEAMIKARLNPQLCETAFQWASGQDFTAAVLSSRVATGGEGVVTRTLRRLDELMREVTFVLRHDLASPEAAQVIQNTRLLARRGVLAAPSAYLGEAEDRVAEKIEAEPPWPKPMQPPGFRGDLDPLDMGFSQNTCGAKFRAPPVTGGPDHILAFAKELCDGSIHPSDMKPLNIYWFRHRYYSLDNRRLAAFRLFRLKCEGAKVPVIVLNRQQALEELWLKKFSTGFTGGQKIRITQTDRFVGITREQSTFGCSLWDGEGRTFPMARLQNLGVA